MMMLIKDDLIKFVIFATLLWGALPVCDGEDESMLFASPDSTSADSVYQTHTGTDTLQTDSSRTKTVSQDSISNDHAAEAADSMKIDTIKYTLDRVVPNKSFQVGEKLYFSIRYGFIHAGTATMEVRDITAITDSVSAYHIISTARSASFFDVFYKVRDEVETFLDINGLFSWKYNKKLREGGYKFDLLVDYHQPVGVAYVNSIRYHNDEPLRVKNKETFTIDIPEYVVDVLGAFYYVRTQELEVGMPIYMANHDNKKVYDLQVIIQRKETIKVGAGKFRCIVVKPQLRGEALFKQKGELWVWLTDDERKIPVKMKSKVAVGSITTELKKIEGVPLPLKSRVK